MLVRLVAWEKPEVISGIVNAIRTDIKIHIHTYCWAWKYCRMDLPMLVEDYLLAGIKNKNKNLLGLVCITLKTVMQLNTVVTFSHIYALICDT